MFSRFVVTLQNHFAYRFVVLSNHFAYRFVVTLQNHFALVCGQPLKTISHIALWSFQNHFAYQFVVTLPKPFCIGLWSTSQNHFAYRFVVLSKPFRMSVRGHPSKTISHRFVVNLSKPFRIGSNISVCGQRF